MKMSTDLTTQAQVESVKVTKVGFANADSFEYSQRVATALSKSTLIPKDYQNNLPNCLVALNMADRMNADVLMVMQNLHVIHGRPGWSSQFLIATCNTCGRFSAIRYEEVGTRGKDDWGCIAWMIEKETGKELRGTKVDMAMAKAEGWYDKTGSKWKTMPDQMLKYRAAAFLVRCYAPELSLGLHTAEENADIIDVESRPLDRVKLTRNELPAIEGPTE
jgi:hypothetical protein